MSLKTREQTNTRERVRTERWTPSPRPGITMARGICPKCGGYRRSRVHRACVRQSR